MLSNMSVRSESGKDGRYLTKSGNGRIKEYIACVMIFVVSLGTYKLVEGPLEAFSFAG